MSILVTGGAGYIGSHTVYELIAKGYDTVVIDNLTTGHRQATHKAARFYEGDILDAAFLDSVFEKESIDGVIHFAACSLVGESVQNPLKYYRNNVEGTRSLTDAMIRHGVKSIVFSSTAAVYGEPETNPIRESERTCSTNPYGETKLAIEKMLSWCDTAHSVKHVALRYFNACGADKSGDIGEAHSPETHLIPIVLQSAMGLRGKLEVYGADYGTPDGTCIRDYIHVTDLARAHILAYEYLKKGGKSEAINLGSGSGFSVLEIIAAARESTGLDIEYNVSARRPGDPATLVASSEKARAILGWQPEYSLVGDMISSAYVWHKAHPNGFDD